MPRMGYYSKIMQTLNALLNECDLSSESLKIVKKMFEYFETKLARKDEQIRETLNTVKELQEEIKELRKVEKKVEILEKTVETLKIKIDENEQYERRGTLIMSGAIPPAQSDEDCSTIVRSIFRERNLIINKEDISIAHRIGRKRPEGNIDNRNRIVKLTRRDLKSDIINACKQRDPKVYINESLTPTRSTISYVLRQVKKLHNNHMGGIKKH